MKFIWHYLLLCFFLLSCYNSNPTPSGSGFTIIKLDTNPNIVIFGDEIIRVEPREDKFRDYSLTNHKYDGRILIMTNENDSDYHTVINSTKDNAIAQRKDGKVTITVHLPVYKANSTVYFRVVDPDRDDDSPYEEDDSTGDNLDRFFIANPSGVLSANSSVAVLATINNKTCAAAEVVLDITKDYAGDNYQVEASLVPLVQM